MATGHEFFDRWSRLGLFTAAICGATMFGAWHGSAFAGLWMLMVLLLLLVHVLCFAGLLIVLRQGQDQSNREKT